VFRGGFDREAARQVAGASLGMLAALVAKSLVRRPEAGRYDLHELIRQYATVYLEGEPAERAAARQQHYAFYLALAQAAAPQLKGPRQLEWLRRLEQEHDNFRTALSWSLNGGQVDTALRLAGALRWFWGMRGYFDEGRAWLMKALQVDAEKPSAALSLFTLASPDGISGPADKHVLARALEGLALLDNSVGNHSVAYGLAKQSVAICRELGDKQGLADALVIIGEVLRWQGDAALSHTRLEEALALYREVGDRWSIARSLFRLGQDLTNFGGDASGRAMLEESSAILEEVGDSFFLIGVVGALGVMAVNTGDYPAARSFFDRGLALAREMSDPWGRADLLTNVGCVQRIVGDYGAADSTLQEALSVYEQWGRGSWCADPRCALAENEIAQGNLPAARIHLNEACPCADSSGNKWLQVLVGYFEGLLAYYEGDVEAATACLEKTILTAREGQYKPDLARALVALGRARGAQHKMKQAAASVKDGLRLFSESDFKLGIAMALEVFAGLVTSENPERAARSFGSAEAIRYAIGAPMPPVDRPGYERDVAAVRGQIGEIGFAAARARGQAEPYEVVVAEILASPNYTN
jgi:tetratricopeptide (TPR) repeat protein